MIEKIQQQTRQSVKNMERGTSLVEEGVTLAGGASQALGSIVDASRQCTDMVTRIAAASEQQSKTASAVASSMDAIQTITRATETSTVDVSHAAQKLNRLADELKTMAAWFKGQHA
jgi:methyl-accepting chemotaxis protein